jgi:methionyl-tRNA formyltransferase
LLPTLAGHTVRVGLTERVGQVQADEPLGRRQLRAAIGCTLHYIRDARIDTGDIVEIHRQPLQSGPSLLHNILSLYPPGIQMLCTALQALGKGHSLPTSIQRPDEGAYYSYPTAQEWEAFTRHGWRIADPTDLQGLTLSYM